jgi:acylphosphatase
LGLEKFLQFLHQGPPSARVDRVAHIWLPYTGEFRRFRVRWL